MARFQADHVNRHLIPAFYRFPQAQESEKQAEGAKEVVEAIEKLVEMFGKADEDAPDALGLWIERGELGWVEVMAVPWLFRVTNVLKHYRGFELPKGKRFDAHMDRSLSNEHVKTTCSTEDLYMDSYARYAGNRPNTSQARMPPIQAKGCHEWENRKLAYIADHVYGFVLCLCYFGTENFELHQCSLDIALTWRAILAGAV